jgi:DinB superfamily
VLAAVIAAASHLRSADLDVSVPDRDRTLRELIYDVFYKARFWVDDRDRPDGKMAPSADAARYRDPVALAACGREVHARLVRSVAPQSGADYDRIIDTPDGRMTIGEAVGWLASHSAHHLRQVYWMMEYRLGVRPADPLDVEKLPGVVLPAAVW